MDLARHSSAAAAALILAAASRPARADYTDLLGTLAQAVSSKSPDAARKIGKSFYFDDSCSSTDPGAKDRLVAPEVDLLDDPALAEASLRSRMAPSRLRL